MLKHKNIDRICCIVLIFTLLLTVCFMGAAAAGLIETDNTLGYEKRLFDTAQVHTIDIVMDDWEGFLETCTNEEYSSCAVVIDGESYKNVAIRAKGNTSLSSVAAYGNNRYSFKIEFDHYDSGKTYYGLDKLCLNNIIQDKTYLKDYVSYTLMNKMGVAAPLCSFVQIRVNGETWGLYLAVEAVEESFLQRNYGKNYGELYKPDSMSMGGGRGNGREFDMDAFSEQFGVDAQNLVEMFQSGTFDVGALFVENGDTAESDTSESAENANSNPNDGMFPSNGTMPGAMQFPTDPSSANGEVPQMPSMPDMNSDSSQAPSMPDMNGDSSQMPSMPNMNGDSSQMPSMPDMNGDSSQTPSMPNINGDSSQIPSMPDMNGDSSQDEADSDSSRFASGGFNGGMMGGMGSSDVMLQYSDDDPSSYSNIFDNAKTKITEEDQQRLIAALKNLSEGEIEGTVDTDAVIRYFVVHNFLCNDDSYTGQMVHNYYLYEKNGVLSMIPWDYNLAFGGFSMGGFGGATSTVNSPIDSPVSSGTLDSRPMVAWIFNNEEYTALYHEIYQTFVDEVYTSGWLEEELQRVIEMISPYVESDPTAFFTYEEFQTGSSALIEFCNLRFESIAGQLDGSIPSTTEEQNANSGALIDASNLSLSDLGEFSAGGMGGDNKQPFDRDGQRPDSAFDRESTQPPALPDGQSMNQGDAPTQPTSNEQSGNTADDSTSDDKVSAQPPALPDGQSMKQGNAPTQPTSDEQSDNTADNDASTEKEFSKDFPTKDANAQPFDGNREHVQTGGVSAINLGITAISAVVLILALFFAKFYKVNR